MEQQPLITREEAADLFRVSIRTIDRWRITGQLPALRVGRSVRFRPADIQALINDTQAAS